MTEVICSVAALDTAKDFLGGFILLSVFTSGYIEPVVSSSIRVGGMDLAIRRATTLSQVWIALAPENRSVIQLSVY